MKVEQTTQATITVEEKKGLISSQPAGSTFYIGGDSNLWMRVDAGGGEYVNPEGKISCIDVDSGHFSFRDDVEVTFRDFKAVPA